MGSSLKRPKPLLLLAYVAMEGPKDRQHLAELFFPHAIDQRDALSTTLRRLRSEVGLIEEDGAIVGSRAPCDARRVQYLLDKGQLVEATREYGAPFLLGFNTRVGAELEEWVYSLRESLAERVRLAHLFLAEQFVRERLLETAAHHLERANDVPGATAPSVEAWERMHAVSLAINHPSEAWLREMTLAPTGSHSDHVDLGTPTPPGAPASRRNLRARSARARLPTGVPFIGRKAELSGLLNDLSTSTGRLISLTGVGGAGKTRLAVEALRRARKRQLFRDGAVFVALGAILDGPGLINAVVSALPLELQGSEPPEPQLIRFLQNKQLLLILDNFEQLLRETPMLERWLKQCELLVILVTSRETLNVARETVHRLTGLRHATRPMNELGAAAGYEAVELFYEAAVRHVPSFTLTDENLLLVLRLCELVDGLPLALKLVASWLPKASLASIVEDLKLDPLIEVEPSAVTAHARGIRTTLKRSWVLLSTVLRAKIEALSVFVGGFSGAAAFAVTGVTPADLGALTRKSLLQAGAGGRYEMHPLVRLYANERLNAAPESRQRTEANHATYYVRLVKDEVTAMLSSSSARVAGDNILRDLPNIRLAWQWALVSGRMDLIGVASESLTHFAELRSAQAEVLTLFNAGLQRPVSAADQLATRTYQNMMGASSLLLYRVGSNIAGLANARAAQGGLAALPRLLRNAGTWAAYYGAGLTAMLAGEFNPQEFDNAITVAREDLQRVTAQQSGTDDVTHATSLLGLALSGSGMLLNVMGEFDLAKERLEDARRTLEPIDSPYLALTYRLLHELTFAQGELREARMWLEKGLHVAEAAGYHTELASLRCYQVRLLLTLGEVSMAEVLAKGVMTAVTQSGDKYMGAFLATLQGWMALRGGATDDAKTLFFDAIESALAISARLVAMEPLAGLAQVYAGDGALSDAAAIMNAIMAHDGVPYLVRVAVHDAVDALTNAKPKTGEAPEVASAKPGLASASPEVASLLKRVWATPNAAGPT